MKKNTITLVVVLFSLSSTFGQNVTVTLEQGELKIPQKEAAFKYDLPLSFFFDDASFRGKTIKFYIAAAENKKVVDGIFGTDLSPKSDDDGNKFYEIKLLPELTLDLKSNTTKWTGGALFFKIDGSKFIGPVNFNTVPPKPESPGPGPAGSMGFKPGSPVNDAIRVNEIVGTKNRKKSDDQDLNAILNYYGIKKDNLATNKFLNSVLKDEGSVQTKKAGDTNAISSALSSIGGLDVTRIADGFARFVVKRTKEELSIAFFEKFNKELEKYPDLETVFPNTKNLLEAMGDQIYNYSNYINNLREAFRSDLQTLDEHLPGIIENHPEFFEKEGNFILGTALRTGCYVSISLRHDMHPGDILETYPTNFFDGAKDTKDKEKLLALKGAIQTLQVLSESLKENDPQEEYWVSIDKVRQVVNDKQTFKIFIGLTLQIALNKYNKVIYSGDVSLYGTLNDDKVVAAFDTNYPEYKQYFLTFGSKVNELNQMIKDYKIPQNDSLKVEQYAKYFKATAQFVQYCVQATTLPYVKEIAVVKDLDTKTKKYFTIAYEVSDLATAINRKRYPEAVNHAVVIYNIILKSPLEDQTVKQVSVDKLSKKNKRKVADEVIAASASTPDAKLSSFVSNSATLKEKSKEVNARTLEASDVLTAIAKYGSFMSGMVAAKDSKEIAASIEAAALPSGSSRIKRESNFNVAINAYTGLFIGREVIKGLEQDDPFGKTNTFGVTVPIGISISKGHRILPLPLSQLFKTDAGWSSSWFISIVDIGAIAAFRFQDETTEQIPSVQLKDIISPGLFWSVGIPKTPLSINIGAQMGPNLRKVRDTTNDYSSNTYVRYSASICVDIPLLNLYSKTR